MTFSLTVSFNDREFEDLMQNYGDFEMAALKDEIRDEMKNAVLSDEVFEKK